MQFAETTLKKEQNNVMTEGQLTMMDAPQFAKQKAIRIAMDQEQFVQFVGTAINFKLRLQRLATTEMFYQETAVLLLAKLNQIPIALVRELILVLFVGIQ